MLSSIISIVAPILVTARWVVVTGLKYLYTYLAPIIVSGSLCLNYKSDNYLVL